MAFALLAAALGGVGSPVAKAGAQAKPDRRGPAPIASVTSHSEPFHSSLPASLDKAYPELAGAGHVAPQQPQHDDRQVLGLVAQALRRQRHPLRAVAAQLPVVAVVVLAGAVTPT